MEGRALILPMYGTCGCYMVDHALTLQVYGIYGGWKGVISWSDSMSHRISGTLMNKTYSRGRPLRPVLEDMQGESMLPESSHLVNILFTYADEENLAQGRRAHTYIVHHGYQLDIHVGNALINMYGKCGITKDARKVFDTMSARNAITWNAIIAVYAHTAPSKQAIQLFEQMHRSAVMPNRVTILTVIFACASHASLHDGKKIHDHISGSPFEADIVVRTALVNMYGKCGSLGDARMTFEGSSEHDVVSWNAMISVYVQHGQGGEGLRLFAQMRQQGELPNKVSLLNMLSACANEAAVTLGKQIHTHITASEFRHDLVVGNALINMYSKCGNVEGAWGNFDSMFDRDIISWNAIIAAYAQNEASNIAFQIFYQMQLEGVLPNNVTFVTALDACSIPEVLIKGKQLHACIKTCGFKSNIIVGNALVNMYGMCGKLEDALRMFDEMPEHNKVTFVNIVSACISQAALTEGTLIHACIIDIALESDVVLGNTLINLYSKCGRLRDAHRVFDNMPEKNVVSWTTIIAAYSQHGQGSDAIQLFEKMQKGSVKPNKVTFVSILSACSHAGLVEEGHNYFRSMTRKYGIEPTLDHYHCMIDLLGRSGRLIEAEKMLDSMPFDPTAISWMILLGACKKEVDIDLAERATRRVMELDPEKAAPYIMLLHVYLSAGREDAAILLSKIQDPLLQLGCSSSETKSHRCLVNYPSHPTYEQTSCCT